MTREETIDRCANYLLNTYEAMDGTHEENKAALAETLEGDDFIANRVLRSWMLLPPRSLLRYQQTAPGDNGLRQWLENVID